MSQHSFPDPLSAVSVCTELRFRGEKLAHTIRKPFSIVMKAKESPNGWEQLDNEPTSRKTRDFKAP